MRATKRENGSGVEHFRPLQPSIASGNYAYAKGDLFAGFDRRQLEGVIREDAQYFNDLGRLDTMAAVERVFLARNVPVRGGKDSDGIGRSVFVANPVEKALLARGEILPDGFREMVFPGNAVFETDPRFQILNDSRVQVICVNNRYPDRAVRGWLERAIEPDPNAGNIGVIGMGAIGYHMVQGMVAAQTVLAEAGHDSPFRKINILQDPHPSFPGRMLEVRHTLNAGDLEFEVFDADNIARFFQQSSIVLCIFSGGIPHLDHKDPAQGDVRMMQFRGNQELLGKFVNDAERADFRGTLVVVSDPPEHLASSAVRDNAARVHHGTSIKNGLLGNHQIIAQAGVTNTARAEQFIRELMKNEGRAEGYACDNDDKLERLLSEFRINGGAFGPHGQGTVIANSTGPDFDARLSDWLAKRGGTANYDVRQGNKLPADAPASNLIIALQRMLGGRVMPVSLLVGDVVTGVQAVYDPRTASFSVVPYPDANPDLIKRVENAANLVKSTYEIASSSAPAEQSIPCRSSAFWANGVVTGECIPTRLAPTCSGRDITSFNAIVMALHHFTPFQGDLYIPEGDQDIADLIQDLLEGYIKGVEYNLVKSETNIQPADGKTSRVAAREPLYFNEGDKVGRLVIAQDPLARGPRNIRLPLHRKENAIFLAVDVAVDSPQNIEMIKMLRKSGAVLLGFTPRMHNQSPRLHFGFIGDDIEIDSEFPVTPLLSSLEGNEGARRVFSHWQKTFSHIRDVVGGEYCASTYREKAVQKGKDMVAKDPLLQELLVDKGLYDQTPQGSLYEHVLDVTEILGSITRILGVEKDIDRDNLNRLGALHDLGKGVYLLLNHYKNAALLQRAHVGDTGVIRSLSEEEIGTPGQHWRYGRYLEELRQGRAVEIPDFLKPYERFVDFETGVVTRDVEIAKEILRTSSAPSDSPELSERLMEFFDSDENLETCSVETLLIELADNLSDYGKLSGPEDIAHYLKVKEQYVLARYGRDDASRASIRLKFENLRRHTADLLETRHGSDPR